MLPSRVEGAALFGGSRPPPSSPTPSKGMSRRITARLRRRRQAMHAFIDNFNFVRDSKGAEDSESHGRPIPRLRHHDASKGHRSRSRTGECRGDRHPRRQNSLRTAALQSALHRGAGGHAAAGRVGLRAEHTHVPRSQVCLLFFPQEASIGLFNTRVDRSTPQLGSVMRTSCDLNSGTLFCVGDLFPTLARVFPDRPVAFDFRTAGAPSVIFLPDSQGVVPRPKVSQGASSSSSRDSSL